MRKMHLISGKANWCLSNWKGWKNVFYHQNFCQKIFISVVIFEQLQKLLWYFFHWDWFRIWNYLVWLVMMIDIFLPQVAVISPAGAGVSLSQWKYTKYSVTEQSWTGTSGTGKHCPSHSDRKIFQFMILKKLFYINGNGSFYTFKRGKR